MHRVKRFLPLIALGCVIVLIFAMGWNRYLSLDTLRDHGQSFRDFTTANYVLSLLALMLLIEARRTARVSATGELVRLVPELSARVSELAPPLRSDPPLPPLPST